MAARDGRLREVRDRLRPPALRRILQHGPRGSPRGARPPSRPVSSSPSTRARRTCSTPETPGRSGGRRCSVLEPAGRTELKP
ncbi:MAG: hypothetical protein M0C28_30300 [Candidatus Moduliflexus flocculans]|nr:hypothetical protein [Candidatus Moduliflexus flocculans]